MKIAMPGAGCVGLVSGACFPGFDHDVVGFDSMAGLRDICSAKDALRAGFGAHKGGGR
jgi:hypothetical protein